MRQSALDANLRRPEFPRFLRFSRHIFQREEIRIGLARATAEGAEFASHEADIGEIDVPVHHVTDDVADQFAAQRVAGYQQRNQVIALGMRKSTSLSQR
jgi:hypothetical protein